MTSGMRTTTTEDETAWIVSCHSDWTDAQRSRLSYLYRFANYTATCGDDQIWNPAQQAGVRGSFVGGGGFRHNSAGHITMPSGSRLFREMRHLKEKCNDDVSISDEDDDDNGPTAPLQVLL